MLEAHCWCLCGEGGATGVVESSYSLLSLISLSERGFCGRMKKDALIML